METTAVNGVASRSAQSTRGSEISERPKRRRFSVEDKRRILNAADACALGTLGALLRREGIYSSLLAAWRAQRDRGDLDAGVLRRRASRKSEDQALLRRNAELERDIRKLNRRLQRAELILDIQKKAAGLMGIELQSPEIDEND
jgi:transposase-like protein